LTLHCHDTIGAVCDFYQLTTSDLIASPETGVCY